MRCLTEIATTRNHSEQRHCAWFDPLWEIDLEPVITDQEDFDALVAFWRARKGASFRFRHPLDQEAVHVHIGTGTGTATQFQLLQTYSSGITGDTYTARRIVHLPVATTVTVTLDNVLTTDYTLNATTGVVTFSTAPGVGVLVRWSGLYDLPMRFAAQEMPTELVQVGRFANALTLVEDRASAAVAPVSKMPRFTPTPSTSNRSPSAAATRATARPTLIQKLGSRVGMWDVPLVQGPS